MPHPSGSGGDRNFHLRGEIVAQGVWGTEVRDGIQGRSPVRRKLKLFADIVCRFCLQKPSKFENFKQFAS